MKREAEEVIGEACVHATQLPLRGLCSLMFALFGECSERTSEVND